MDALVYFVSIVAIGVSGFAFGRFQRERGYRAQSAANLARSLARRDARSLAVRHSVTLDHGDGDGDTTADSDSDPDSDHSGGVHQARRRTIHRYNGGFSSGPAASRGARRRTDEASLALAVAGYDG